MPQKYDTSEDKNFDDLVHRFKNNIYGRLKGKIRLAVIQRDLAPYLGNYGTVDANHRALNIIDAGGGQGQFAIELAKQGHHVTLCDISTRMLSLAKENAAQAGQGNAIQFLNCSLQTLKENIEDPADMILCHAVLEWMSEPHKGIAHLAENLKSDGILSLAIFNRNSIIYKNLLRGNYRKAASNDFVGTEGSLTPINPLDISDVLGWCREAGLELICHSGIRVFHDYISDHATRNRHPEAVVEMELAFSQQEPYRSLGRYIHVVARKT